MGFKLAPSLSARECSSIAHMSMRGDESTEELVDQERQCLARFRERARELQAANPALAPKIAFCKAVEQLSATSNRYQWTRQMLEMRGVRALPLR
jgi:uncharacterized protein with von Willebrand factor type A (vWA) domain